MKRILLVIAAFVLVANVSFAQGKKSLKAATKKFAEFSKAPFANGAILEEAKALLEEAFQDETVASDAKAWLTRADIYYNSGDAQIKGKLLNPEAPLTDAGAALASYEAYMKAVELDPKKGKKKALKGLANLEGLLNNMGIEMYQVADYAAAYDNFAAEMAISKFLGENKKPSRLDDPQILNEKLYSAGLCAYSAKKYDEAEELLMKAKDGGSSDASVYQVLFESMSANGKAEAALPILEEGRAAHPDDSALLFAEINYYLQKGELDAMISKLEAAYEKEPDNTSVILTLGQVYDQLQVKSNQAGDTEKAGEHFENALKYYKLVLDADAENFDANYGAGALYYNKAAALTDALNEVANDFTKAGEKKYNDIKATMDDLFNQSLPYFLKADSINSADRNTLIALKELYARQGDFEKSNVYKERLEGQE